MSPRIEKHHLCPHCKAELPRETPRVCPECAGSLQKRFLSAGCLTSAPPLFLLAAGLAFGAARALAPEEVLEGAREEPRSETDAAEASFPTPSLHRPSSTSR